MGKIRAVIAGAAVAVLAGCGSSSDAQPQTVVTVTAPPPVQSPQAQAPQQAAAAPPQAQDAPLSKGSIEVPSVVGKSHQLAQDMMQDAGLYNLAEEDATGAGRALILDRGWVVVSQSPKAGTKVNEDQTIVLRSKKVGE